MSEPTKTPAEIIAEVLRREGDVHSWRCEYTEIYGPCSCIADTAALIVEALIAAGVVTSHERAGTASGVIWFDESQEWDEPFTREYLANARQQPRTGPRAENGPGLAHGDNHPANDAGEAGE